MPLQPEVVFAECYEVYERSGQYAVYDLVSEKYPEIPFLKCDPCEDLTPNLTGACLVCATPSEKEV